jgi:hypothetical protein
LACRRSSGAGIAYAAFAGWGVLVGQHLLRGKLDVGEAA